MNVFTSDELSNKRNREQEFLGNALLYDPAFIGLDSVFFLDFLVKSNAGYEKEFDEVFRCRQNDEVCVQIQITKPPMFIYFGECLRCVLGFKIYGNSDFDFTLMVSETVTGDLESCMVVKYVGKSKQCSYYLIKIALSKDN